MPRKKQHGCPTCGSTCGVPNCIVCAGKSFCGACEPIYGRLLTPEEALEQSAQETHKTPQHLQARYNKCDALVQLCKLIGVTAWRAESIVCVSDEDGGYSARPHGPSSWRLRGGEGDPDCDIYLDAAAVGLVLRALIHAYRGQPITTTP